MPFKGALTPSLSALNRDPLYELQVLEATTAAYSSGGGPNVWGRAGHSRVECHCLEVQARVAQKKR